MMKKLTILIIALATSVASFAQEGGEVLGQMAAKMAAMSQGYAIRFEVRMPGIDSPSQGHCIVSGEKYTIAIDDLMQGCDGRVLWMVNPTTREVTLDRPMPQSHNLLENPTKAFDFAAELFGVESCTHEAAMIHLILTPKEGVLAGVERIHLVIDSATMLPSSLSYDFAGAELAIIIADIAPHTASDSDFVISPEEQYPDYEIIDFR